MIKRNVLANMLGSTWGMILQFVFVPVQIRLLNVEAYGLLAFLASVQIIFNLFDLGLSPTITREVAGDQTPDLRHSRDLVQSLTLVYCVIGVVLSVALALAAPWIATEWLRLEGLPTDTAILALQLGALAILIRWPVTFFGGVIAGRQRFDLLNLLGAGLGTLGLVISIAVIVFTHSLIALLVWRIVSAVLELALFIVLCFRLLPGLTLRLMAPLAAVKHVWRFAGGMNALSIQALILTQGDRFLISKILPISALGYYSVAYGTSQTLVSIQGTVSTAMFPAFSASHVRGKVDLLAAHCAKAAQLTTFSVAFPAFLLAFFGFDILRVWIGLGTAQVSYLPLAILAMAFLLNAPLNILSLLAVATDHVRTILLINIGGVIGWVPCLYLLTTQLALPGAALTFLLLQIYYLVVIPPLVLRDLDQARPALWLGRNVLPFLLIGMVTTGTAKALVVASGSDAVFAVVAVGLAGIAYLGVAFLALHVDFQALGRGQALRAYLSLRRLMGMTTG